jgi:tetratricopeptide (TPR) repeat protein
MNQNFQKIKQKWQLTGLLFACFLLPQLAFSQVEAMFNGATPPAKKVLEQADISFEEKDYYSAMKYYEYVLEVAEEPVDILYKYAQAARFFDAYSFADTAYTKVLERDSTNQFPIAKFYLAKMKKQTGHFADAKEYFEEFLAGNPTVDNKIIDEATQQAEDCTWAASIADVPNPDLFVERMKGGVNSPQAEFGAFPVGETTYFSSLNYEKEEKKVFPTRRFSKVFKVENGGTPTMVDFNDKDKQTAYASFNREGTRVYYTICGYVGPVDTDCEIYYRNVIGTSFGEAVRLPNFINREGFTNTQPSIGYDEATGNELLFFVSDRKIDSKGGLDIWFSLIDEDGNVKQPANLAINTEGNDVTPFFHNPTKTLYFSTDGRRTLGGYDFYSSKKEDKNYAEPTHLPAPINTSYNDTHYYLNEGGTGGYFASNRLGSLVLEPEYEACCSDLYEFSDAAIDLTAFTFNIKDETALNGVTIDLYELEEDGFLKKLDSKMNLVNNAFPFTLKKSKKYVLKANKEEFAPLQDTIDLTDPLLTKNRFLERNLYLVPVSVDLNIFTFNKKTKRPLPRVEIRLVQNGEEIGFEKNEEGNEVNFRLRRGNKYRVITFDIDLPIDGKNLVVNEDLFLRPKEIEEFPPLMIFFDNDQPNPNTRQETTELTYDDTFQAYMAKKDVFTSEYTNVLEGRDSFLAVKRIDAFFEREVNNGYESLKIFCSGLKDVLENDFKVILELKGFTSPRADSDYNDYLSKRRADCLNNHILTFDNGALKKHLDSGQLSITEIGFGESTAPQFISDKMEDARGSIYSISASFERKVEIVGVRIEQTN